MCLPAWGGKPGLLLNLLGMAWGRATWGSRHTDPRDSRLGTNNRPSQKHRLDQLHSRAAGRAMSPITLPVPWPLLAQNSWAFPLQDQSLVALRRAGGAGDPQLGGDPVSAGLLGAGLLLCLERGQINPQSTARVDDGAWAPLPGRWNHWCHGRWLDQGHCPRRGQVLQSGPLIPNPWLDRPLHIPLNSRPAAFPHLQWRDQVFLHYHVSCRSFVVYLDKIKKVCLWSLFSDSFYHSGCWVLSNAFMASIEMIIWFFSCVGLIWWITLVDDFLMHN